MKRVGCVTEVYTPGPTITGLFRDFAIVSFSDGSEKGCVRTLNKVLWKGRRLRVEVAKDFYKEKFKREREETALMNDKVSSVAEEEETIGSKAFAKSPIDVNYSISYIVSKLPVFDPMREDSAYLRIRRVRGGEVVSVRSFPATDLITTSAKLKLQSKGKLRFGWKTRFDENGLPVYTELNCRDADYNYIDGREEEKYEQSPATEESITLQNNNENEAVRRNFVPGKRVGFGTLLLESKIYPEHYDEPQKPYITHTPNPEGSDDEKEEEVKEKLGELYDEDIEKMTEKEKFRTKNILAEFLNRTCEESEKMVLKPVGSSSSSISKSDASKLVETENRAFVNVSKFTDIFHKEGGVWWGDDGTLKEHVFKGSLIEDTRFREAEKLGIDIRPMTEEEKADKCFKLNFFTDEETEENRVQPISDEATKDAIMLESWNGTGSNKHFNSLTGTGDQKEERESIQQYNLRMEEEEAERRRRAPVSIEDIISTCKLFCRQGTEQEIIDLWRNGREKRIADYKRKKKDSKRRAGKNSKVIEEASKNDFISPSHRHSDNRMWSRDNRAQRIFFRQRKRTRVR